MKTDHDSIKALAESLAGSSRNELYAIQRANGLSAADAFALATEIHQENVAQIRRAGFWEILFGTIFIAGAVVVLIFKSLPLSRGGFVIVLAGLAGIAMLFSGLPKVTFSGEACARATEGGPAGAPSAAGADAAAGEPGKKIPSARIFSVWFGSITILLGIGWWLMIAE